MFASIDSLRDPAVLIAFGGWNDAGDAATNVLTHLANNYPSAEVGVLDSEEFFDFQVSRPMVSLTLEGREITWPAITATVVDVGERDLLLLQGPEPNLRWRTLIGVLTELLNSIAPTVVVLIGAMLSDSPHTRPLPVLGHSTSRELTEKLSLSTSTYEGPTGIIGVLADGFEQAGLPVMSLWASVPHYVSNPPNPKATLALLGRLSDVLGVDLEAGELPVLSTTWERSVNELAEEDPDIAEYITSLEERQDTTTMPQASGDSIAAEFERYLRRQGKDDQPPQ